VAITNGYCTLAEFYERYESVSADSGTQDTKIEDHIEAASRWIDRHTMRKFYATTETRYFTARDVLACNVTDLLSVTTLKTDEDGDRTYEVTWKTTDYDLMPYNDTPYQWLEVTPNGSYYFPTVRRGVEIAGSWGYVATTPEDIKEACLLQASRLFGREAAVLGVGGATALGTTTVKTPKDEDIFALLEHYVKRGIR
jgi:hypothetical protein